ncbi:MAG: tannase/feruloyl esterase family alpha/beta hydrolase [Betaproteobacteria bacterium]|nr:MAG: tannase/feruloyl esterase family alpha/beta hydrolase [Betaproteobacteria bacterium]
MKTRLMLCALLCSPAIAGAIPMCADLATNPAYGLAGRADVLNLTVARTGMGNNAGCEVTFIYSSRGGPEFGYDEGEMQRVTIRVGLPYNSADGGSGGSVEGAWNGKTRNLGGGGCVGSVGSVTSATSTGYVGSSTDSGHIGSDCIFALQPTPTRLNVGRLNDFIVDSLRAQVRWAKAIAETYYGPAPARNYWDGCSTGGRQGLALAQRYPEELDGWLVGAPAVNYGRFRIAQIWGPVAMKELTGGPISPAKTAQATLSAITACDAADGVMDGVIGEPRSCKFSAKANVCGEPTAPAANCLTPQEAAAIDLIWDGPRNTYGKQVFPGLERGAQISALNGAVPSQTATGQLRWNHSDASFDWSTLTLADYGREAQLGSMTTGDIINTNDPRLDRVRDAGKKILMWQGTADQLITAENGLEYYTRVAAHFAGGTPEFSVLQPWFRYFRAPGVAHCGGGPGPQPNQESMFQQMVNWVENGVAPDTVPTSGGGRTRMACPFPQQAIYDRIGNPNLASSWTCGGNVQTKENICQSIVTPYKHESEDQLQAWGKYNPAACNESSNVPIDGHAVDASSYAPDPDGVDRSENQGYNE